MLQRVVSLTEQRWLVWVDSVLWDGSLSRQHVVGMGTLTSVAWLVLQQACSAGLEVTDHNQH